MTTETDVTVTLALDDASPPDVATGVGFFDHMLTLLGAHGLLGLTVRAAGDLHVDQHHTVEDVGLAFGQALAEAVGDKRGVTRYGDVRLPMDEVLACVALDLSGRPATRLNLGLPRGGRIGDFDADLVAEFLKAVATSARMALHVDVVSDPASNLHHVAEAVFKGFGRALGQAVAIDPRRMDVVPSTKGTL